ncbi:hypothetical protein E4U12_004464 [Claviceps purpurea]|nr:hypothetical protein E4U12_004464 [Claviceps purpurea]
MPESATIQRRQGALSIARLLNSPTQRLPSEAAQWAAEPPVDEFPHGQHGPRHDPSDQERRYYFGNAPCTHVTDASSNLRQSSPQNRGTSLTARYDYERHIERSYEPVHCDSHREDPVNAGKFQAFSPARASSHLTSTIRSTASPSAELLRWHNLGAVEDLNGQQAFLDLPGNNQIPVAFETEKGSLKAQKKRQRNAEASTRSRKKKKSIVEENMNKLEESERKLQKAQDTIRQRDETIQQCGDMLHQRDERIQQHKEIIQKTFKELEDLRRQLQNKGAQI